MKRFAFVLALLLLAAGYVYLQTVAPAPKLAGIMPGGALVYLEAPDFGHLLRDWDSSQEKAEWLKSDNYSVFSRSNLFIKLQEVYGHYVEAAGFSPDLKSILEVAGTDSALALYDMRDVEFLYVSRIDNAELVKSQLWAVRDKFEQRQAGGLPFYRRTDAASKSTVAFAFAKGYLLLATRDDLVAQALELLAGGSNPRIASDRWYHDATAAAQQPGELRMAMNLEALVKSSYFRSYWVQRNVSAVRQYWAAISDVRRAPGQITESRIFLGTVEPAATGSIAALVSLVPPDAGLYRASFVDDPAALIVNKLIGTPPPQAQDSREAPWAASPDIHAGSEADLEARIDEQPLPADAGTADAIAAVRGVIEKFGGRACLLVQSSLPADSTFVQMPAVIVVEGARDWDTDTARAALAAAAGKLWTTSQLGALDSLGTLNLATRGHLLFLGNNASLFAEVLGRVGTTPAADPLVYAAGFRHLRERPNYERISTALDFGSPAGTPMFFSENITSLSRVLSKVADIRVTEEHKGTVTFQTVRYEIAP
jgi:hypothetical protein